MPSSTIQVMPVLNNNSGSTIFSRAIPHMDSCSMQPQCKRLAGWTEKLRMDKAWSVGSVPGPKPKRPDFTTCNESIL